MTRLFGSIVAFFLGLLAIGPTIDQEQARSDAAGLVAYAALAQAPPAPAPVEAKEQKAAKEAKDDVAAHNPTTAAPAVTDAESSRSSLPLLPPVQPAPIAPVGPPTFAPARIPTPYYAPQPAFRPTTFRYRSRW
jgi:hypothetical protein